MTTFVKNEKYMALLIKNNEMTRRKEYNTTEWKQLQKDLIDIERVMSSGDIIRHAEICFPHVQEI